MSKYSEMKVPQLVAECKSRSLKGYSSMQKVQLVKFLEASDAGLELAKAKFLADAAAKAGSVNALKHQCRNEGIKGFSGLSKSQLEELVDTQDIRPIKAAIVARNRSKVAAKAPSLDGLTVEQLKQICRDRQIKKFSGLKKADLIDLIESNVAVKAAA